LVLGFTLPGIFPYNIAMQKKVLSIEDDAFLSSLVSGKLIENGFSVVTAATGKDGIEKSKTEKPDVILLDLMLPDIGGFDILKTIKADPETKDIPVIILSNLGGREEIEESVKLGADGYLIKSNVLPQEVADMVNERVSSKNKG
jgi:CheY-like chemotaxis protein